jgi:multidrug efflux pump subunit AcrB
VCVSIPLAALFAIAVSSALGETINVMSLGGLALAVGMLVDDATVEIEKHSPQPCVGRQKASGDRHIGQCGGPAGTRCW